MRWDFASGAEGFVFADVVGTTSGYWSAGRLYMDGGGSWGDAYWRIEFPHGVYSVNGVSTVSLSPNYPGNCYVQPSIWDWGGNRTYGNYYQGEDPAIHTATQSEEIKHIGVQCNIYNNGFYAEWIEIAGFTGIPEDFLGDIYTSCLQLGSAGTAGIFTCGTQIETNTNGIYVSNTRLNSG